VDLVQAVTSLDPARSRTCGYARFKGLKLICATPFLPATPESRLSNEYSPANVTNAVTISPGQR
jgi:hypothetical protein